MDRPRTGKRYVGLRILGVVACVILLGWWFWPRSDAPQTEQALVELAVKALRERRFEPLRPGTPNEPDLAYVELMQQGPLTGAEVTSIDLEPAFALLLTLVPPGVLEGPLALAGRDPIEPHPHIHGVRDVVFRVSTGGPEHRFRLRHCVLTPRGWITLHGLQYDGPVLGPTKNELAAADIAAPGSVIFSFTCDPTLPWNPRRELAMRLQQRVRQSKFELGYALTPGPGRLEVVLPGGENHERDEQLPRLLMGDADVEFAIRVQPESVLAARRNERPGKPSAKRKSAWTQDAKAFAGFKQHEFGRIQELAQEGRPYIPGDPAYRLVRRRDTGGTSPDDYWVVETTGADPIDSTIMVSVKPVPGPIGGGDVKLMPRHTEMWRVHQWTDRNVAMPYVVIVGGEAVAEDWIVAPSWNAPLGWRYPDDVSSRNFSRTWQAIEDALGLPRLPYPIGYSGVSVK